MFGGQYEVYTMIGLEGSRAPTAASTERRCKQRISVSEGQTGNVDLIFAQGSARVTGAITINGAIPEGHVRVTIHPDGNSAADWHNAAEYNEGTYRAIDLPEGPASIHIMVVDAAGVQYVRETPIALLPDAEATQDVDISGTPLIINVTRISSNQEGVFTLYEDILPQDDRDPWNPNYPNPVYAMARVTENGPIEIAAIPSGTYTLHAKRYGCPRAEFIPTATHPHGRTERCR